MITSRIHLAALFAGLALLTGACGESAPPLEHPHVILLLADDLGWGDVGYHGSECATPRIDRLASEGLRLEQFHAAPMCSPFRAGLMTGRSAPRMGMLTNVRPPDRFGLPLDERTMAEAFRDAGYATALVGKWHLGHGAAEQHPLARGFDYFYGFLGGWIHYYAHGRGQVMDWQRNRSPLRETGYATHLLTDDAVRLIEERDPSRPLFLLVAFNAPHVPLTLPPGLTNEELGVQSEAGQAASLESRRIVYRTMVEDLDASIGRIIDTVQSEGLEESTILLFASDNGAPLEYGGSNAPLRGEKYTAFDGGVRTPAILRWPGHLPSGEVCEAIVSHVDLFPTLAAAAGIILGETKPLDGVDRGAVLHSSSADPRDPVVVGADHGGVLRWGLRDGAWKLVEEHEVGAEASRTLLFDVGGDPGETADLSAAHPEVVDRLRRALDPYRHVPRLDAN